jgi:hypothetical protein
VRSDNAGQASPYHFGVSISTAEQPHRVGSSFNVKELPGHHQAGQLLDLSEVGIRWQ